jgi:hypothetical protein
MMFSAEYKSSGLLSPGSCKENASVTEQTRVSVRWNTPEVLCRRHDTRAGFLWAVLLVGYDTRRCRELTHDGPPAGTLI